MPRKKVSAAQRERAAVLQTRLRARFDELHEHDAEFGMEDLAHAADIERKTLDNYFRGESPSPQFFLIAGLADALQLELGELVR